MPAYSPASHMALRPACFSAAIFDFSSLSMHTPILVRTTSLSASANKQYSPREFGFKDSGLLASLASGE